MSSTTRSVKKIKRSRSDFRMKNPTAVPPHRHDGITRPVLLGLPHSTQRAIHQRTQRLFGPDFHLGR